MLENIIKLSLTSLITEAYQTSSIPLMSKSFHSASVNSLAEAWGIDYVNRSELVHSLVVIS